jgi:hypothetical protein
MPFLLKHTSDSTSGYPEVRLLSFSSRKRALAAQKHYPTTTVLLESRPLLKAGDKVIDRGYPQQGRGTVIKVLKTRVHIQFPKEILVYDTPHYQFLNRLLSTKASLKNTNRNVH